MNRLPLPSDEQLVQQLSEPRRREGTRHLVILPTRDRHGGTRYWATFAVLFGLWLASGVPLAGADEPAPANPPNRIIGGIEDPGDRYVFPSLQKRKQDTATVGVLILVGVTAIGLLLIAGALIWGAKVRRLARTPTAEPTQQDDLWSLRKGATSDGTTTDDESADPPPSAPDEATPDPSLDSTENNDTRS